MARVDGQVAASLGPAFALLVDALCYRTRE